MKKDIMIAELKGQPILTEKIYPWELKKKGKKLLAWKYFEKEK